MATINKSLTKREMYRLLIMLLFACACACALQTAMAQAERLNVHLVMSDSSLSYQQFADALNRALVANNTHVSVSTYRVDENPPQGGAKIALTITVGLKATEFAVNNSAAPLLSVMVPRSTFEMLREKRRAQRFPPAMSAIYLEQTWERQFNFIRAALPRNSVVGLLYSQDAHIALPRLPPGMSVNTRLVRSNEAIYDTLENIFSSSNVLLVTPDSEIYSSNNMRNILLTSYRYKVPLVGISQAYVNAGALCAIYSSPEQIALQAAEMLASFVGDRSLPEPQYPDLFSMAVNQQVARSLGIVIDSPEAIRQRMDKSVEGKK